MSDPNDNADPKLERLLRRWGAEEASGRAPIGRAPHEPPPQAAVPAQRSSPLPWVGLLAVAAAAIVGFVILFGKFTHAKDDADRQGRLVRQLQASVADLETKLTSSRQATTRSVQDVANQMDRLARDANEAKGLAAFLKTQLAASEVETKKKVDELGKKAEELALWPRKMEAETARVTKALEDANAARLRLSSAVDELERARKTNLDAIAATKAAQTELADLKARDLMIWNDFQQAYLAAAAPGETGLRASQAAVKRTQLVERLAKVRATVDAPQKALLEKLEVVLTRLEMVEPSTFVSEDLFRTLLRTSGVMKQIDEAMTSPTLPAPVRGIYFEARLILAGAERVG
jgi:DNA repair exonuclease SbcCD ATPase subunit